MAVRYVARKLAQIKTPPLLRLIQKADQRISCQMTKKQILTKLTKEMATEQTVAQAQTHQARLKLRRIPAKALLREMN